MPAQQVHPHQDCDWLIAALHDAFPLLQQLIALMHCLPRFSGSGPWHMHSRRENACLTYSWGVYVLHGCWLICNQQ